MKDLKEMSSKELEQLLKEKREQERKTKEESRKAYEGLRGDFLDRVFEKVFSVSNGAKELADLCSKESVAFRAIMADYGQIKKLTQQNFKINNDRLKLEVRSNKVKRFDERADLAATRLIEFLRGWIKGQKDGTENPMYQLAMTLLERNKNGDLDYKSISKLYDMESQFSNPEYSDIMRLFKESNVIEGTAINYYFYRKDDMGVWRKIEPSFNRL